MESEAKLKKQQAIINEIERHWTAEELFRHAMTYRLPKLGFTGYYDAKDGIPADDDGKRFVIDDDNRDIITAFCYYFTNDPRFEEMNSSWDLEKGILIQGGVGRGKSILMRLFGQNKKACFDMVSCRLISDQFADKGHEILHQYAECRTVPAGDYNYLFQRRAGKCFDDIGTEGDKNNWGNKVNVMSNIILNIYDKAYMQPWYLSHFTTNLSYDEIETNLGTRERSRLAEMTNQIILPGQDRRRS